jgi:hypothetical protein
MEIHGGGRGSRPLKEQQLQKQEIWKVEGRHPLLMWTSEGDFGQITSPSQSQIPLLKKDLGERR